LHQFDANYIHQFCELSPFFWFCNGQHLLTKLSSMSDVSEDDYEEQGDGAEEDDLKEVTEDAAEAEGGAVATKTRKRRKKSDGSETHRKAKKKDKLHRRNIGAIMSEADQSEAAREAQQREAERLERQTALARQRKEAVRAPPSPFLLIHELFSHPIFHRRSFPGAARGEGALGAVSSGRAGALQVRGVLVAPSDERLAGK
jgi:hypothetical protein